MGFKISKVINSIKTKKSETIYSDNINSANIKRRNFFKLISAGALGTLIFSKFTFLNNFTTDAKNNKLKSKIKIEPNPYAVKRDLNKINGSPKGKFNG
jgi:hypothetical protein